MNSLNSFAEFRPTESDSASQRARLLAALHHGPVTTSQARALLGTPASPAARVLELRKAGLKVQTLRTRCGFSFEACYVLERQP
jgi:hypothetical protein